MPYTRSLFILLKDLEHFIQKFSNSQIPSSVFGPYFYWFWKSVVSSDIDLTKFQKVKTVLTFGESNHKVLCNCPLIELEDCIDFSAPTVKYEFERVYDFEPTANKQQILTLCQTSGSTGPPKIVMFKNQTPMRQLKNHTFMTSKQNFKQFLNNYGFRKSLTNCRYENRSFEINQLHCNLLNPIIFTVKTSSVVWRIFWAPEKESNVFRQ